MTWFASVKDALDPYTRRYLNIYLAYQLSEREYIGELPLDAVHDLDKIGYEATNPLLEALKYHWDTDQSHDWSKRKIDPANPRYQYHVHGWHNGASWSVASHWELRPDLGLVVGETPRSALDRLRTHYSPKYGDTYIQGRACPDLLALV